MLTNAERKELQELLAKRGFELGAVDGKVGPKTRAAIRGTRRPLDSCLMGTRAASFSIELEAFLDVRSKR